jgi:hypothetical protein
MYQDCCPECGHLLSRHRNQCPFCGWNVNFDPYSYSFKLENDLLYHDRNELRPDQLPGY